MKNEDRQNAAEIKEANAMLLECFPGSFINDRDEFIAHPRTNQYFSLQDCKTVEAVEAKVLEYLSRAAFKHGLMMEFIDHDMSIEWLKEHVS